MNSHVFFQTLADLSDSADQHGRVHGPGTVCQNNNGRGTSGLFIPEDHPAAAHKKDCLYY